MRWLRWTFSALVTLALLISTEGLPRHGFSVSAAPSTLGMQKSARVNQAARAAKLAARVYGAHTHRARYQALLSVMKALHIGVRTIKGKAIIRGAEHNPRDLFLYDFEVSAIATQLAAGKRISLDTLATLLAHAGFTTPNGAPLDVSSLQTVLTTAIRYAVSRPTAAGVLEPLLLRRLGLRHATPNDLVSSHSIELDALQFALITADLFGTLHYLHSSAAFARGAWDAYPRSVSGQASCGDFSGGGQWTLSWIAGRMSGQHMTTQVETGTLTQGYHGDLLGVVELETDVETPNGLETHYGPAGHAANAGKTLIFRVHVTLLAPTLTAPICGTLADLHIPPGGPLRDVLVTMDTGSLEKHGTVTYAPSDRHTTKNGVVQMTFTPKDETVPDFGQVVTSSDFLQVSTSFHAYDTAKFGQYLDRAGIDIIPIHWSVSRHAPRGFKFTADVRDWHDPQASGEAYECTIDNGGGTDPGDCNGPDWYEDTQLSGSVCGEDPYATPWNVHVHIISNDQSDGAYGLGTADYTVQMSLPEGQTVPSPAIGGEPASQGLFALALVPGSGSEPLQLRLDDHWSALESDVKVTQATLIVPVEEDTSCPAPTP